MPEASTRLSVSNRAMFLARGMAKAIATQLKVWLFALLMMSAAAVSAQSDTDYLPPDEAFKMSAQMADAQTIAVTYQIANGYYLYRERFAFQSGGAKLGTPVIPPGKIKFDETFQKDVETYRHALTIMIPVQASAPFTLMATSQGCADKGLCYPPMTTNIELDPSATFSSPASNSSTQFNTQVTNADMPQSDGNRIEQALKSGKLFSIVPLFLLLGIGLAFTPCVLPMVPILSSIIVGEGANVKRRRGFSLALVYSLGMALVYTLLGVAAGLLGEGLSAALQNVWVLGAFGLLMVVLALSMFDVYRLQMPAAIQTRLTQVSDQQRAGKMIGVFIMGALSALIVGPCVAAPLAGALVYISQTRDVVVGGGALFAMAIGMSVPLLLIGLSAGALLPRAGAWMDSVKRFFGVLMLGVALWMISPVIPVAAQMLGWSALGIGYGAYLIWTQPGKWLSKAAGIAFIVLGAAQLVGVTMGNRDPLAPLARAGGSEASNHVTFKRIKTVAELDDATAQAKGKHVMLDFYADWCVSCIEMERFTFTDPRVRTQLDDMVLLQIDVTKNNADDKQLLKRFDLFGPPGIIFFNQNGREIRNGRVIGFQNADKFNQSLTAIRQL